MPTVAMVRISNVFVRTPVRDARHQWNKRCYKDILD